MAQGKRIHFVIPQRDHAMVEKVAKLKKFDTLSAYVRRALIDDAESFLQEQKRIKAR